MNDILFLYVYFNNQKRLNNVQKFICYVPDLATYLIHIFLEPNLQFFFLNFARSFAFNEKDSKASGNTI